MALRSYVMLRYIGIVSSVQKLEHVTQLVVTCGIYDRTLKGNGKLVTSVYIVDSI